MMLVHWGNTNSKHNHSTTAYWADNWDTIPSHRRGDHPCFDPEKDLVLPAWKRPEPGAIWLKLWARYLVRGLPNLYSSNGNFHLRLESTVCAGHARSVKHSSISMEI